MPNELETILKKYHNAMETIFGNKLERVVLYGSYARGDYNKDSDIDIMILADIEPEKVWEYADKVDNITYDINLNYGLDIMPTVQSLIVYKKWQKVHPFYLNIEKEGVTI